MEDKDWAVYGKDFDFEFIPPYEKRTESPAPHIKDGLLWIETVNDIRMAIVYPWIPETGVYSRDAEGVIRFHNTNGDPLPQHVTEITFYGGTLDYLYDSDRPIYGLMPKSPILSKEPDGTLIYTINDNEGKVTHRIKIGKRRYKTYTEDERELELDETYMRFEFESTLLIHEAISLYGIVILLVRFMANRYEVGFRQIRFGYTESTRKYPDGEVFVKRDYTPTRALSRDLVLTFQDIGICLQNLLHIFTTIKSGRKVNYPDYSLDFFPKQSEMGCMTNETICKICSSLEYETTLDEKIKNQSDSEIEELSESVHQFVKEYAKEHKDISQDTLNLIYNSVSFWSLTARNRFILMADNHADALEVIKKSYMDGRCFDIKTFVDHRNQLMHSASIPPSQTVVFTALILRGLIYISILHRAGMDENQIISLCKESRINS